jgi:D-lactate dehydrogenase (cytochrome)
VDRTYPEKDSLFFKIQGSDDSIKATAKSIRSIVDRHEGSNFQFAATDEEASSLWEARKYALMSVIAAVEGSRAWTTDVWYVSDLQLSGCRFLKKEIYSVPVSKLPQLVHETKQDIASCGLKAGVVGHVGDGNPTYIPVYN